MNNELRELRYAVENLQNLVLAQIVLFIIFIVWLVFMLYGGRRKTPDSAATEKEAYILEAQQFFDTGEFSKLQSISLQRSNECPHDPYARWFAGLAFYKQGKLGNALSTFKHLQSIDPAWNKETVELYIEEIKDRMNGPESI